MPADLRGPNPRLGHHLPAGPGKVSSWIEVIFHARRGQEFIRQIDPAQRSSGVPHTFVLPKGGVAVP